MTDLYSNPHLIHTILRYEDGALYWKRKIHPNIKMGIPVGNGDSNGRLRFTYRYKMYSVHRVIYAMHHNHVPKILDHIDGDYLNNRIENLREATQMQNMWNAKISKRNKTGAKGVRWIKPNTWQASCMVHGVRHHLGYFKSIEEAKLALSEFRIKHQGEFARNE